MRHRLRRRLLHLLLGVLALGGWTTHQQAAQLPEPAPFTADLVIRRPPPEAPPVGYPIPDVDQGRILSLVRARRFDDLDRLLGEERDRVLADIRREEQLTTAFRAFSGRDRDVGACLEEWVRRSPGSRRER